MQKCHLTNADNIFAILKKWYDVIEQNLPEILAVPALAVLFDDPHHLPCSEAKEDANAFRIFGLTFDVLFIGDIFESESPYTVILMIWLSLRVNKELVTWCQVEKVVFIPVS